MARPALGVWLTTLVWAAAALGLWGYFDHQLKNGTEIELKAIPVDPRDVLRGDYVILRYGFSSVAREKESHPFEVDRTVYVSLGRTGGDGDGAGAGEWRARGLHHEAPERGLFLRGRIRSADFDRYEIVYGIESFFVPEGEGLEYEQARNRNRLWAVASVSPHGVAYLKRLEIR